MTTSSKPVWAIPSSPLVLTDDEVHVWCTSLDHASQRVPQFAQILSSDERERAKSFSFACDRHRFIIGRGVLRTILGLYLNIGPVRLKFRYGQHGKPYLSKGFDAGTLQFNTAHSRQLILHVFVRNRAVGIDLEWIRSVPHLRQIVNRFFSPQEQRALNSLPEQQQLEAFFNCWTRKEAYLKATGDGLSYPLTQVDVSTALNAPISLHKDDRGSNEASRWSLLSFTPAPGYAAALAMDGKQARLRYWQFPSLRPLHHD